MSKNSIESLIDAIETNDEVAERFGGELIVIFQLPRIRTGNDKGRIKTVWGTKSDMGLARTLVRLLDEFIVNEGVK